MARWQMVDGLRKRLFRNIGLSIFFSYSQREMKDKKQIVKGTMTAADVQG